MPDDERNLFDVYVSYPVMSTRSVFVDGKRTEQTEEFESRRNANAAVLASSIESAIELVKQHWPGCSVWNISHRGNRVVLWEPRP